MSDIPQGRQAAVTHLGIVGLLSTLMLLLAVLACQQPVAIGGPSLEEIQALRLDRSVSGHETIPDPFDTMKLSRADVDRMIIETRDRLHNDITEAELVKEQLKIRLTDDYIGIVEEMLERQKPPHKRERSKREKRN